MSNLLPNLNFLEFILIFAVPFLVFLLLRELFLWYFRINDFVDTVKNIDKSLEIIANSTVLKDEADMNAKDRPDSRGGL